jgi:hypothetical protein
MRSLNSQTDFRINHALAMRAGKGKGFFTLPFNPEDR